jgi:CubicO group peptidase (beta-lactamase class C family)
MTFRLRPAALVLLASTVHPPSTRAQDSKPGVTEGLWEAKRRFGPDVRGLLMITRAADGWRADVAGVQAPVRVSGDTFYRRGRPSGSYSYSPPPALGDGWETGTLAAVGLSQDTITNFMRAMVNLPMDSLKSQQVHAVLIARHGKLVLEEYFHGEDRGHAHDTRSAAKSITSTLAGAAIHAKRGVTLASPVYAIMNGGRFPDTIEPRKRRITLEHLLSMSSGIDCDDGDDKSPGNESAVIDQSDEPDYYRLILRLGTIREPGEKSVYCSINPHLAGGVLKNASGSSLPDLFSEPGCPPSRP